MKTRLGDMSWPEVEGVLRKKNVVILPVGTTEQHGRHLPINFDAYAATYLAEQAARKITDETDIPVLVCPTIPYGETFGTPPFKKLLPGSIGLTGDTTIKVIQEVVRSLVTQGFNNVLVLNGHVENTPLIAVALRRVTLEFPDAGLFASNWWYLAADLWKQISKGGKGCQGHACEKETAVALCIEPENVQMEAATGGHHVDALPEEYLTPMFAGPVFYHSRCGGIRDSGLLCDPRAGNKETGEKYLAGVIDNLCDIIIKIAKSEGMKFEEKC